LREGHERLLVPQEQADGDSHGAEQDEEHQEEELEETADG